MVVTDAEINTLAMIDHPDAPEYLQGCGGQVATKAMNGKVCLLVWELPRRGQRREAYVHQDWLKPATLQWVPKE